MKTTEVFLPPGVQSALQQTLRQSVSGLRLPAPYAQTIAALWRRRNTCPEGEVAQLDVQMKWAAIDGWTRLKIEEVRTRLGRRRLVTAAEAEAIVREVAPAETKPDAIASRLAEDPGNITLWSPDGNGAMRYDQPGTLSHTPRLLIASRRVTIPRWRPHWHLALVLRVQPLA